MHPKPLRVMSWNIGQFYSKHFDFARFFIFLNKGVLPKKFLPEVAREIKKISPHVVGLQEVRSAQFNPEKVGQLEVLEKSLKGKYKGFYGPYTDAGEHRALLIRKKISREKGFEIENVELKGEGIGIAAYLPKKNVWFANFHLEHFDFQLRQRQIERLFEWMKEKKEHVILGGDYNLRQSFHFTRRHGLQVREFFQKMIPENKLRDATAQLKSTTILKPLGIQLDYFLTNLPKWQKEKSFVIRGQRWRFMDHYPIVADFFVKTREHLETLEQDMRKKMTAVKCTHSLHRTRKI